MFQSLALSGKERGLHVLDGKLEKHNVQYQPLDVASSAFDSDEFDVSSSVAFDSFFILF